MTSATILAAGFWHTLATIGELAVFIAFCFALWIANAYLNREERYRRYRRRRNERRYQAERYRKERER